MKIHITGNLNPFNNGSKLLFLGVTGFLSTKFPQVRFTKESFYPSVDEKICPVCKCVKSMKSSAIIFGSTLLRILLWKFFKILNLDLVALLNEPLRHYYEADVIIDLSGDGLCPPQSKSLWYSSAKVFFKLVNLASIAMALILNKKVILYSASIGNLGILAPLTRIILNRVKLIVVRDYDSLEYLKGLRVTEPIVYFAPDAAFSVSLPEKFSENKNETTIGFNISTEAVQHFHGFKTQQFAKLMGSLIDYISENYNATVLLIPFSTGGPFKHDDDRVFLEKVLENASGKNVRIIQSHDLFSIVNAINKCSLFVTTRMHSAIVSLLCGVPPLIIAHSSKFHGLVKLIGREDLLCYFSQVDYESLKRKFKYIWANRPLILSQIKEKTDFLRELSFEGLERMALLLPKILGSHNCYTS